MRGQRSMRPGKDSALLHHPPLRTGLVVFTTSDPSLPSIPLQGNQQLSLTGAAVNLYRH
jgi:hypothetical protein